MSLVKLEFRIVLTSLPPPFLGHVQHLYLSFYIINKLPRRFKKAAMLEGESFHRGSIVAVGAESVPYFLADCKQVVEIAPWESWFLMTVIESGPGISGLFAT